jgi:hypothetical protein
MSVQYLVPVVSVTVNGQTVQQPKYAGTDYTNSYAAIRYGLEPLCLLSLPAASPALAAESDVYAFPADLTQPMSAAAVTTLESFLASNNVPSDGLEAGAPFVTALVYVTQIFLLAQFVAGSTNQSGSLFANGVTVNSPANSSPSISAVLTAAPQPTPTPQPGPVASSAGTGNANGTNSASSASSSGLFNFAAISNLATVGEFLDAASQTWAGGAISLGGF